MRDFRTRESRQHKNRSLQISEVWNSVRKPVTLPYDCYVSMLQY